MTTSKTPRTAAQRSASAKKAVATMRRNGTLPPARYRDPEGCRPSVWHSDNGSVAERELADGRIVRDTWIPIGQTHVTVIVINANNGGVLGTIANILRVHAAPKMESLLQQLES